MEKNITMIICNMYHYILHTYNNRYPFTFLYYALIRLYISIVSFIIPLNCYRTLPTFTYLHTHNSNTFYTFTNKFYRSFTSKYPKIIPLAGWYRKKCGWGMQYKTAKDHGKGWCYECNDSRNDSY